MPDRSLPPVPPGLEDEVHLDCVHYRGDRPCTFHKLEQVHCPTCSHYAAARTRLLLVKLDAMGDVLRTTCVLPGLAARFAGPHVTWITAPESAPLLAQNPYVHRIVPSTLAHALIAAESFDIVVNLDTSPQSATLASIARAGERIGYLMSERGFVYPAAASASRWLKMGLFDDVKKANRLTHQELMCEILAIDPATCRYVLELSPGERAWAREWAVRSGLGERVGSQRPRRPLVGLNTGAGGRWQYKRWRMEGYRELSHRLAQDSSARILLLGGEEEEDTNRRLASLCPPGTLVSGSHPVRRFASIVELCDVVVTGDTLGLHLALAMRRPVVVLFGPTSASEIELFGLGEKVVPRMDCLVCYKETCDFQPACMDLITTEPVAAAVRRILASRPPIPP